MDVGYPGAVAPVRERFVESLGVRLHLVEWGDAAAPPLLLTHGFYDHARSFDAFAPLLAQRFRVLALDSRGHGDSDWPDAYTWLTDVLDVVNVLRDLGRPAHLVGHSRGGGLATDAALLFPQGVRRLVNMDGFGPPPEGFQAAGMRRYEGTVPELLAAFLDWRRANVARRSFRPSPSLDELAERRRAQNPRLSKEWLRYFAAQGARAVEGGFVWKVDPYAARGFGPWRPEWIAPAWRGLTMPMLAIWGDQPDTWGLPDPWRSERLGHVPVLETAVIAGAGHFMHIEQPAETAARVLAFLGAGAAEPHPQRAAGERSHDSGLVVRSAAAVAEGARAGPGSRVRQIPSGRSEVALHELAGGAGPTLLLLHALGGTHRELSSLAAHWPGRVLALDLAGHGESRWTRGGAYTPELHAADADAAFGDAGEAFVAGAGLGAYVALLLAGARRARVPGALLLPGRGLDGGGPAPRRDQALEVRSAEALRMLDAAAAQPRPAFDPLLRACETDPRPPEYARAFADAARRLLLAEDGGARPPWWEAARSAAAAEAAPAEPAAALRQLLR